MSGYFSELTGCGLDKVYPSSLQFRVIDT